MIFKRYPTHSDANSRIQETMRLEELRLSEHSPPYRMKTKVVGAQHDLSPNPNGMMSAEIGVHHDLSSACLEEVVVEKFFAPRVECGEKGKCKCQRMRSEEYYEYYERIKDKDHITMYPQGKCELPKGAVFHFTGASDTMKREDINDALVALGAKIAFLDYQSGSNEGWVRLSYKYEARIIIKRMVDKKLNIAGAELDFRVLSGKDEKRYHKKAIEAIFQLQEKTKGLDKKLKKAGYSYVTTYVSDLRDDN